ncbi:MAG: twin-arginine translocation signal domain-containing protein, partial [Planctomycetota bacterium]
MTNEAAKNAQKVTRRGFLRGSAVAAASAAVGLPAIIPSSVFGVDAPSSRITVGCIGVGGKGSGNMRNFNGNPGAVV